MRRSVPESGPNHRRPVPARSASRYGMLNENKGVFGLNLNHWWKAENDTSHLLEPIGQRLTTGSFHPIVAATFSFARAAEAHRYLQEGRNVGKVVLTPN
jgi:synaptic vesicle membrane protein VAT-1